MPNFLYSMWWDRADDVEAEVYPTVALGGSATIMSGYEADWIFGGRPDRPSRINEATGWWQLTFPAAQRIDVIGAIGATLAAGKHLRVQASAAADFSVLTMDVQALVPAAWPDGLTPTYRNLWVDLTSQAGYHPGGYRYWRVGSLDNTIDNLAISELWLSTVKRSLSFVQKGGQRAMRRAVVEHFTERGVALRYDRGVTVRDFPVEVVAVGTDFDTLQDWWMNSKGSLLPGLIIPDDSEGECYMVTFSDSQLPWVRTTPTVKRVGLHFREMARAVIV